MDPLHETAQPSLFILRCDGPTCSRTNVPHMCGRCHNAYYCSLACQKKDWTEGKHKELCQDFDSLLVEATHKAAADGRGRVPRETERCQGRNCVGATLKFPFFVASCGRHWVCPNCVVRAAVANPSSIACPQCGGPGQRSSSSSRSIQMSPLSDLCCEHLSAAGWYLRDRRLSQAEKASISKRVLAAHSLVKEGYFETVPIHAVRHRSPMYTDLEVFTRATILQLGNDPGTLEEARKGLARLRDTLLRGCGLELVKTRGGER